MRTVRLALTSCLAFALTLTGCNGWFGGLFGKVSVSGQLPVAADASFRGLRGVTDDADTVVAIPIPADHLGIETVREAVEAPLSADGSFSLALPSAYSSWLLLAVDSTGIGFDKISGYMAIEGEDARLNTIPSEQAAADIDLGLMTFDGSSGEFVAEFGLDSYESVFDLSRDELRALARLDSMAKRAANLYINDTGNDHWYPQVRYIVLDQTGSAWGGYSRAADLMLDRFYVRATWEAGPYDADDILDGSVVVEMIPPVELTGDGHDGGPVGPWSPDNPFSTEGGIWRDHSREGFVGVDFGGGLNLTQQMEGVLEFSPMVVDDGTGQPTAGIWTVRVNGQDTAWLDFRSGSPYDAAGNPIMFYPEVRLEFDDAGYLITYDARFTQFVGDGFEPVAASAVPTLSHLGINIFGNGQLAWDSLDEPAAHDYFWDLREDDGLEHVWHIGPAAPEDAVAVESVAIEERVYGVSLDIFWDRAE